MSPKNVAVTPGTGVKNPLTNFMLVLKKKMMVMLNKTEPPDVAKPYMFNNLIPNTIYTVDVVAGTSVGFGDPASLSFQTNEDGKIFHNDDFVLYNMVSLHTSNKGKVNFMQRVTAVYFCFNSITSL